MFPGTLVLPAGLFVTGWTARSSIHWIVPDIGIAMVGAGVILNFQAIQTYVIDAFTLHAASALAAVAFLRSLCGFGFPLFAPVRVGLTCISNDVLTSLQRQCTPLSVMARETPFSERLPL